MNDSNKRLVGEVDGIRVNHPHSGCNIFYSILALILAAIPCVMLFQPLIIEGAFQIKGIDYVEFAFKGFKIAETSPLNEFYSYIGDAAMLKQAWPILVMIQSCLWLVLAAFGIFSFLLFFVSIIKGYLRNAKAVKAVATFDFVFVLLFALSFLVVYLMKMIESKACSWFVWTPFVLTGAVLVLLIFVNIIYSVYFRECVQEKDIEYHSNEDDVVVAHVTEVHNVTKVDYAPATELPSDLKSIGGHAYTENQNLLVANIPLGITSIGNSAFSNCLKLKVVSIPDSVTSIGFNCFFNCASLERINYSGTKEQWRRISRGSNWLAKAKTTEVICSDGTLVVNPYH